MSTDITTVFIEQQQLDETEVRMSLNEFCERCCLKQTQMVELVELGLVTPETAASDRWQFQASALPTLHQAVRLRRELDLDWQGVAVAMDLLEQLHALRQQVNCLEHQLEVR